MQRQTLGRAAGPPVPRATPTQRRATGDRAHGRPPAHPGEVLRARVPAGVAVGELARRLGVTRQALSAVLNGRAGVSAPMALRLEEALGPSAERWLRLQAAWDLWHARRRRAPAPPRRPPARDH